MRPGRYIQESTGPWLGLPVYVPSVAKHAQPGALFDPNGNLALAPVAAHAVTIMILNKAFYEVAHALARLENHRHQSSYDTSVLIKRFVFEALDCYLALFYIAFELKDVPKLRMELVALLTVDTVRRVLLETALPLALNFGAVRASGGAAAAKEPGRAVSAELELEEYSTHDDYLEMVIQFGYIVLFASAYPLASFVCLGCNAVELLADSTKLCFLCRRPTPERQASIGGWGLCCYALLVLSIYTNLFLVAASSDQLAAILPSLFTVPDEQGARGGAQLVGRLTGNIVSHKKPKAAAASGEHEMKAGAGRYVVLICVAMEHALLLLLLLSEFLVARAPAWVRLTLARRDFERTATEQRQLKPRE